MPENLRKMSLKERKAYIDKKINERVAIQKEIKGLSDARKLFVAAELKKQAVSSFETLDAAIINAVRVQGAAKAFKFDR
ncbi:MAG: hypothetical protein IH991_00530 [Planctomycetes bacterium]|nr:hypothetical protein [Planctomycetota bacterium]